MASFETEPPPPQPTGQSRRRSALFIAAFVAVQFVVPLTYLAREDTSDERFTWRSFESPDVPQCETLVARERFGGEIEAVDLKSVIHRDWFLYVRQGRHAVVDALLLRQCEQQGIERVVLTNSCEGERESRTYSLRCGAERAYETPRTAAR
jgi:hypothetical protein